MTDGNTYRVLRERVVEHLRGEYLGPTGGDQEIITDRPDRTYLVGTLYPRGPARAAIDGDSLGEEGPGDELDDPIELANAWHPASAAVSFQHTAEEIGCTVVAGQYEKSPEPAGWRRRPRVVENVPLSPQEPTLTIFDGAARLVSVWRPMQRGFLVTVAIENALVNDRSDAEPRTEDCLYQVRLTCRAEEGEVLPYPTVASLSKDLEDEELRLQYRHRKVYGVGHGCSVAWGGEDPGPITWVATEMLPTSIVPGVSPGARDAEVLRLSYLADEQVPVDQLVAALVQFVDDYELWIGTQEKAASAVGPEYGNAATRLTGRMTEALGRMREGVALLQQDPTVLLAFRLANLTMREQIVQSRHVSDHSGKRGTPLIDRDAEAPEPGWYPFQLAFQLLTVASVASHKHLDRETVDLIWFPTGGGKTEAYLAVAAFDMLYRRLTRGSNGGGTAVITRYTLRMLTAQQFQRAATLICALELLRQRDVRLKRSARFTIGLWVGSPSTPNDYVEAFDATKELRKASQPESPFQVAVCPWCGTSLVPRRRSNDDGAYGVRSTKHSFELFCTHDECPFAASLPVMVVDDQLFAAPPTMLVATVDKFARVPWVERSGVLFGRGNVPYDPPSLIIQDELHLLSGPLGTTVALYEAALNGLVSWDGRKPKIVASTATIRSASQQVQRLYGSKVALFPPGGLSADDSYFAQLDHASPGRMYLGLMPQAHTQAYATVLTCVALLQAPQTVNTAPEELDAYWSLVAYHNSLRELGRTVTMARDDVDNMLRRRKGENPDARLLRRDGVIELTSNVDPSELIKFMQRLERRVGDPEAVDLVATTNMLSVGIDISRLGLMLMNGQPKTTAEYIQATSRVGRSQVPGLVITLLRANKPRDRSHYESFAAYHGSIYRHVEPTSVTPWSLASRQRSLHAAFVILMRHGAGLSGNDDAGRFAAGDSLAAKAVRILEESVRRSEPDALPEAARELAQLVNEWERRARESDERGMQLRYMSSDSDYPALLRNFGERREGWATLQSMRSVDRQVRVIAVGEARS